MLQSSLHCIGNINYCVPKSLKLVTLSNLREESQGYVFYLLVEVGFLPFYEHRFFELHLVFSRCRVQDLHGSSPMCRMFNKTLNSADV